MTTAITPATPAGGQRRRTVLLIDDHRMFTDVLAFALDAQPDLRCVAAANSVRDALTKAGRYDFDAAIVDLHLPDGGGLAVLEALRGFRPAALLMVLTGHLRPDLATAARRAGADAVLAKHDALHAVLAVLRGPNRAVRPTRQPRALTSAGGPHLTPREHEVLTMLAAGADARQIARDLCLSVHTVRDYIKAILAKLGVHSQHGAVAAAAELGLVSSGRRLG